MPPLMGAGADTLVLDSCCPPRQPPCLQRPLAWPRNGPRFVQSPKRADQYALRQRTPPPALPHAFQVRSWHA